jgi:DNA-directed RNA polymerase specialized sigma24 family protein
MQELVLIQPHGAAGTEWTSEAANAAIRREFEDRLAECGPLAYRVARGVLRNSADAEDVAQEALLQRAGHRAIQDGRLSRRARRANRREYGCH